MTRRMLLVRHGDPRLPPKARFFWGAAPTCPWPPKAFPAWNGSGNIWRTFPGPHRDKPLRRGPGKAPPCRVEGRSLAVEVDPVCYGKSTWGSGTALPFATVRARDPEGFAERGRRLADFRPPGGESFRDLAARVAPHLTHLLATTQGHLLLVAHAGVFLTP